MSAPALDSADDEEQWKLLDYVEPDCEKCGRQRVCKWPNGKHRCEKCNWSPELKDYAPVDIL